MRKYAYKVMEELARELSAGLMRLRKGYIDAAENLITLIDPEQEYPHEFILFRLTEYRGQPPRQVKPLKGEKVRQDLVRLMLDLSESFDLPTSDYDQPCFDIDALAKRYNVSSKTLQRWRRRGLPARRMVFPDGRKRIGFLASSVQWFVSQGTTRVNRSMKFTQLEDHEKADIIDRARRMAAFTNCSLSDVVKRLAAKTNRAPETIRYTIRNHDMSNPNEAVFPYLTAPLGEEEKSTIYRSFLRGMPVAQLTSRHKRTRGTIYRVINEMRAQQLLERTVSYVYSPEFDLPNADETILGPPPQVPKGKASPKPPADLPPYLRALYDVPLLKPVQEADLFRRYNYLKYKADKLRGLIDVNRVRTHKLKEVEDLLLKAGAVKNRLIRANLRLVVSIAKKHVGRAQTLFELISDGNVSLMRAVEKFDYTRGNRFSTYASWAIIRNFARSVPREQYQMDRFATGNDEILDIAAGLRTYDPNELNLHELRESIDAVLTRLTSQERAILIDHFGLDQDGKTKTLEQLGQQLGISKERVRQIELQAMRKLRSFMRPDQADLLM